MKTCSAIFTTVTVAAQAGFQEAPGLKTNVLLQDERPGGYRLSYPPAHAIPSTPLLQYRRDLAERNTGAALPLPSRASNKATSQYFQPGHDAMRDPAARSSSPLQS